MVEEMYEEYTDENNSDAQLPVFILDGEKLQIPYFYKKKKYIEKENKKNEN